MARTKHVFPTDEIPHLWFHAAQRDARNPQGNLFFTDDTIYSYRPSWPLARIYRNKKGAPALVLGNSDRYSMTTAQHRYAVQRAVPDSVPYFEVRHCTRDTWGRTLAETDKQNLAELVATAAEHLTKAQRALQARNVDWHHTTTQRAIENTVRYMDYFKMRGKRPQFPAADWAAALDRAHRIESPDPVRDAKRYKAQARRREQARAALQGDFDAYCAAVTAYNLTVAAARATLPDAAQHWRDTGKWPAAGSANLSGGRPRLASKTRRLYERAKFDLPIMESIQHYAGPVLLRVNGEQIQTSQGARIPLAAAPMVWAAVERVRQRGADYKPSGLGGIKIGEYAVDSIGADGTLKVGCHVIPHSELRSMARQLGLVQS